MATTYTDAQMLWPLTSERLNCSGILGTPIVANTTNSRVCGVQTNRTIAERCCGSAEVQEYQCWLYCESSQTMNDWATCVSGNSTVEGYGPFCQGGLTPNNTATLTSTSPDDAETSTSSAFRSSPPRYGWVVFVLVFAYFFIGPAQATTILSLDTAPVKRQSDSSCTLAIDSNYTSLQHGSKIVSPSFDCTNTAGNFCAFDLQVETPLLENNRTLNGSSAAESEFDAFFDIVSTSTNGRKFPALSSANLTRGMAVSQGQTFRLGWTPISVGRFRSSIGSFERSLILQC